MTYASDIEYRAARPEDLFAVMRAQELGFGGSIADDEIQKWTERTELWPDRRLCAFDGTVPVAQVGVVPTMMHWHGHTIPSAGVTDVFTIPTHRRRGILRTLMTRVYAQMREAGQAIAILEASMAAIYQRFGWAVVYTALMHDFDPRHLRFVDDIATPGHMRLVPREQAQPVLEPVYRQFAPARTLCFNRADHEWRRALRLATPGSPPLVAVYEEEGQALGYVIYNIEEHTNRHVPPSQRLSVSEFVWNSPAAHRALVNYLAGHDLVVSVRIAGLPLDDPLIHHVQEPRWLQTLAYDGALARIIDLRTSLLERGYAGDGRITVGVDDTYAPWNSGVWELTINDSVAVRQVTDEPQLYATPRVLALLLCGAVPATTLARGGLLAAADPTALLTADTLFRTNQVPFCLDHWM